MRKVYFILFMTLLGAIEPEIDLNPPDYVENMPEKEFIPEFNQAGSLFGQGDRPLFADRRAMRPDDLITVLIDETSESSFNTNKTYNGASGGNVTPPIIAYNGNDANQKEAVDFLNDQANFSLQKSNNASNFQGGGNQTQSQNTKLVLTARIVKVLENGNYFIRGDKEILINGEKQIIRLSGVIRSYDITRENTIASKYIADAKIEYQNLGAISDTTKQKPTTQNIQDRWLF